MDQVKTEPVRRKKIGGVCGPKAESTGPIESGAIYSLDEFCRRSRQGATALRNAFRKGLKKVKVGNIVYIKGSDFLEYVDRMSIHQKDATDSVSDLTQE